LNILQDYLKAKLDGESFFPNHSSNQSSQLFLTVLFCGIKFVNLILESGCPLTVLQSPGRKSAEIGHHFAGRNNHFWPCLYQADESSFSASGLRSYVSNCLLGFTPEQLQPTEDFTLPDKFCLGLVRYQILNKKRVLPHSHRFQTNLVDRPSAEVSSPYFVANPVADGHIPQEAELSPTEMAAGDRRS
jgi:hypothetical protein